MFATTEDVAKEGKWDGQKRSSRKQAAILMLQCMTLRLQYITYNVALRYITLHYITLHYITFTFTFTFTLRYITLHYITFTLHGIALQFTVYITSHYITFT